jgi:crotonobetainyl-CoA:carnitine CoA-transferase CaiB-like acyl-CoA transferase
MAEQPFEGIKVLDLTQHIAGPFCTKQFADYGAEVIKIEKPGTGDLMRNMPPFVGDEPDPNKSIYFLYLNTNKKSITLNLKSGMGKKNFHELVKDADILVESYAPRVRSRLGLEFDALEKINPKLVMASISNFGQTGPYRDFKASELVEFGMGGAMSSTGLPEREPKDKGRNALLFETGLQAWYVILGAYMGARKDGIGDYIDISIQETQLAGCERRTANLLTYQYTGDITLRVNPMKGRMWLSPAVSRCKDGYVTWAVGPGAFPKFLTMIDRPELVEDPKWNIGNVEMIPEADKVYNEYFGTKGKLEVAEAFQDARMVCTPLSDPKDVCTDPHWEFRKFFVDVDHPSTGKIKYPRGSVRVEPEWWQVKTPAPFMGQHNEEIYGKLGYSKDDLAKLRAQGII